MRTYRELSNFFLSLTLFFGSFAEVRRVMWADRIIGVVAVTIMLVVVACGGTWGETLQQ